MKALLLGLALGLGATALLPLSAAADPLHGGITTAPQPTACVESAFSAVSNGSMQAISLKLTNQCGKTVDFQNASINFLSKIPIDAKFTGDFGPLSLPDNDLTISSRCSGENYLSSFSLHFPAGGNSLLPASQAITIRYNASMEGHIGPANVYLQDMIAVGNIELTNLTAKPTNVSQAFASVHIMMNGQAISDVQLPWSGMQTVPNLAVGSYNIVADNVSDSTGVVYQATVTPATVSVMDGQTVKSTISYKAIEQMAKLAVKLQTLPSELAGYTGVPSVLVTQVDTGSAVPVTVGWGATATVSSLKNGAVYRFSTPTISFNGYECKPTFTPTTLTASDTTLPLTSLTFMCTQVGQSTVTLNVSGAPTTLASLKVTLTPNNGTVPVSQTVALMNGSGTSSVLLATGVVYNVSSDAVAGYNISFNPQPLTAAAQAIETITLTQQTGTTPVSMHGQLRVCGTHLCNEHGQEIQLRGMSSHGIQWYGWQGSKTGKACLTTASLDTLTKEWNAGIIRISMYVQEGGYETDPAAFTSQVNQLIEEATKRGVYAIVDWHMLEPGNPNFNLERAKTFFTAIATAHKSKNNLLYEIANEPSGVSWATIKTYAESLIPVIRAIDPKTVILVGTPAWSSLGVSDGRTSQDIINAPLTFPNIMYTFHFYAASHKDAYYNELDKASNVLPIFVTEFGTQTYTGDGGNDFVMADKYLNLLALKKISWTNWNYSDDFRSGAVWKTGTCSAGPWTDASLKPAGVYIKAKIKG